MFCFDGSFKGSKHTSFAEGHFPNTVVKSWRHDLGGFEDMAAWPWWFWRWLVNPKITNCLVVISLWFVVVVTMVSALNTVTVLEICSRGYIHMEIQMLSNSTPFSRHLLFLPAVFMLLYHHFGPRRLSHQLVNSQLLFILFVVRGHCKPSPSAVTFPLLLLVRCRFESFFFKWRMAH